MFYKQPKPETIARNKETNKKLYAAEIKWLSENLDLLRHDLENDVIIERQFNQECG